MSNRAMSQTSARPAHLVVGEGVEQRQGAAAGVAHDLLQEVNVLRHVLAVLVDLRLLFSEDRRGREARELEGNARWTGGQLFKGLLCSKHLEFGSNKIQ